ncbi:MAG TPA: type II toxin-antitoxin system RelB/DinJ family antitoxin [Bryobacteraceae bacterium]
MKRAGLTVSDAFRLLLVRVAAEKTLPFEPLQPNEGNRRGNEGRAAGRVGRGRQAGQVAAKPK